MAHSEYSKLQNLQNKKYFPNIDMLKGHYQIPFYPDDCELITMVTSAGLYEWKVMPFGLCNAPPVYQRIMDTCLKGLIGVNIYSL